MNKKENSLRPMKTLSEEKTLNQGMTFTVDKSGYILLTFTAEQDIDLKLNYRLTFSHEKLSLGIIISPDTFTSKIRFEAGEELRIIGFVEETACRAKAVLTKEYYDMFRSFQSPKEKLAAMRNFSNLPERIRERIAAQIRGEQFTVSHVEDCRISSLPELRFKFEMCRDTYNPQQQMDIEGIFDECGNLGRSNKEKALRRLVYILNIDHAEARANNLSRKEIINGLNRYLYKLDLVKEKIAEAIVAAKYANKKGMAILLVGSPGVGKTAIMKAVAKVLGRPYFVIPLGSSTSLVDIVGSAPHYDSSDCGEVVKNFYKAGTTSVVVGLDEYDKAGYIEKEGAKVSQAFNDALSDEHIFKDVFLGTCINTSNTIFIASANSTETISENLLNRFTVIHIDDYSIEDKVDIAHDYIIPEILSSYNIPVGKITIGRDSLAYIAANFCEDEGVRDVRKHLKTLVDKVLSIWDENGNQEDLVLNRKFVEDSLKSYVDESSPVIFYRRNIEHYSKQVAAEIKELIVRCRRDDLLPQEREKYEKKLNYLVRLIPSGSAFSSFDADEFFDQVNKTHYGLDRVKEAIAQIFYVSRCQGRSQCRACNSYVSAFSCA